MEKKKSNPVSFALRRKILKYFPIVVFMILFVSISACSPGQLFSSTLTKTSTSTLTTTITPTKTATPTNTPTLTATPVPNGPCDNPLIPLGTGNQWVYRVTTPIGESRFSLTSLGIQQGANIVALVEYSDQKNNLTVRYPIICQDEAIVNYPLFVVNMLFSDYLDKYISTSHESGDYAPSYQSLIQNNWALNWQAGYLTEDGVYLRNPWGQADLYIPANTQIEVSFILNGLREAVTSPAGNFPQALKITQFLSLPVTGSGLYIGISQWYEPYIGLVRAQINAVLMGRLKLPVESTLELVEFTPGN